MAVDIIKLYGIGWRCVFAVLRLFFFEGIY